MENKIIDLSFTESALSINDFVENNTAPIGRPTGKIFKISEVSYGESMPGCDIKRYRDALTKIINYNSIAEPYGDKYQQMVLDIKDIARRALNED